MEKELIRKILFQVELYRRKYFGHQFRAIGLTPGQGQPRILKNLLEFGPMTQKALADLCTLDVTTMSRTLDKLEEAGLLTRKSNPSCRRSFLISLTDSGVKKAEEVNAIFDASDQMICEGLDDAELERLYASMCKIRGNFEKAAQKILETADENHKEK